VPPLLPRRAASRADDEADDGNDDDNIGQSMTCFLRRHYGQHTAASAGEDCANQFKCHDVVSAQFVRISAATAHPRRVDCTSCRKCMLTTR
jgi:hypothetical protein